MSNERFKFRVWDVRKEVYLNPDKIFLDADGVSYYYDSSYKRFDLIQYDVVVEQCTGLRDKNGKLIFEGDVLGYADKASIVVEWDCKNAEFRFTQISDGLDEYIFRVVKLEIIGNIHEMELEK